MWIVRLALRRPYTFVVLSMLIALLGIGSAIETPKDIFPNINIPVITIVWTYAGLTPTEMEGRIVTVCERALTTTVNDMEHTESESYQGVAVIKVYFQPSVQVSQALAQVTSIVQTILRVLPQGTYPPFVIKYDASSVPIVRAGAERAGAERGGSVRRWAAVYSAAAGECEGGERSVAVGRQGEAGDGGYGSEPDVRAASVGGRRVDGDFAAERNSAGGHGADGRSRVRDEDELEPG